MDSLQAADSHYWSGGWLAHRRVALRRKRETAHNDTRTARTLRRMACAMWRGRRSWTRAGMCMGMNCCFAPGPLLEILETLTPTAALLEVCREMKAHGFRLALDDFEWKPAWRPFVELADYIKVDLSTTTQQQRAQIFANLRGSDARLVAERVETQADLKQAKREGFNLFQGYYFCRPAVMENRVVPANNLMHVEMLQALQDEPLDTQRVSNLAKRDASLTYRLLRMEQILLGLRS
jgi:predicted signal transduction protein with EAL and GGDEF domain